MTFGPIRILQSERLLGLSRNCPECGGLIRSDGKLYFDEGTQFGWSIGYWCPTDRETLRIWSPADNALIQELTRGVDVSSLPVWDEGPK